ncbi:hypothetical protein HOLDEFILI_02543 [Holdemania filiformis DSM 12042]|uniref:Uncharacterized protein n=1 Tax=Holdemania filiformis DSM 12042 TaxID=545696 RepID=B9Y9N6_9FIRM|nr:hypothetical protein HOLDEFILI_02543 [Holdemania filiformis DSM 12042]
MISCPNRRQGLKIIKGEYQKRIIRKSHSAKQNQKSRGILIEVSCGKKSRDQEKIKRSCGCSG